MDIVSTKTPMDMMDRSHVQFKDSQIGSVGSCHYVLLPIMVVISSRIGRVCLMDRLRRVWDSSSNLPETMSLRRYIARDWPGCSRQVCHCWWVMLQCLE
jgi:hypothetical protein